MDCEERLAKQVEITTGASPATKVWVYRNSILALPWYGGHATSSTFGHSHVIAR